MLEWVMIGVVWLASIEPCSLIVPILPPSGTEVLVEATSDSVLVELSDVAREELWFAPEAEVPDSAWGQRFIVRDAFGVDERPGAPIVVVPWAYQAQCMTVPWRESAVWVEPGRMAVFGPSFSATPGEGANAFHAVGWLQPYVDHVPSLGSTADTSGPWLEAEDYFEFRRRFAIEEAEGAEAAIRAWVHERAELAEMNPVRWYLRERGR